MLLLNLNWALDMRSDCRLPPGRLVPSRAPPIHFSPLLVYFCFHISTQLDPLLLMYMIRQPEYCRHSCGCQSFYSCQSLRSESSPYLYFGTGGTGREANTGEDFTVVCPEPDNQKPNVAIGCNVKATE